MIMHPDIHRALARDRQRMLLDEARPRRSRRRRRTSGLYEVPTIWEKRITVTMSSSETSRL